MKAVPVSINERPTDVNVAAIRWYLRYGLSYRDVEELLLVGQQSGGHS
jgi:transposase-like protein